jgi:hypothetical protein
MNLFLKRRQSTAKTTIGDWHLRTDAGDRLICRSCEDIVRPTGVKVPGQTAIPAGIYEVVMSRSPRFSSIFGVDVTTPEILNVPGFTGVRIHPLSTAAESEGCIGPGLKVRADGEGVEASGWAYGLICALIGGALAQGEQVFLELENAAE